MHRTRRVLAYSAATLLGLAAVVTVTAAPASADSTISFDPSSWAYVDSQAPKTPFVNQIGGSPIGTTIGADNKAHTFRSYFTYDLSQYQDVAIHSATWFTHEWIVNDCNAAAPVELWRTKPVKANTTWNNQPQEIERIRQYDRGAGGDLCPGYLVPDLVAEVSAAVARHEKSVTFELRIAQSTESDPALGRSWQLPRLSLSYNHVPKITEVGLVGASKPCATLDKHPTGSNIAMLRAKYTDADPQDLSYARFAVWSVTRPDQRIEFNGSTAPGQSEGSTALSQFTDGELLAFSAQANDPWDVSQWAKPCYFEVDRTGPAQGPAVASNVYREGPVANGGPGVKGKFRLDAQESSDVVSFAWRDNIGNSGSVKARQSGGTGTFEYTPAWPGRIQLIVASIDAAGNRSPDTTYEFEVRDTAPWSQVDVAGVGLPSQISIDSRALDANAYSYQIDGAVEVKFAAGADGIGRSQITFTQAGYQQITLRSYKGNKLLGSSRVTVSVSDAPQVDSSDFTLFEDVIVGKSGTFTFKPRTLGVTAYVYDFGDSVRHRVAAATDGTASVSWTADTPGWVNMTVQSELADGTQSYPAQYGFSVRDNHPWIGTSGLTNYPRVDGAGIAVQVQFQSWLPNVVGFAYRFDGRAEQTVGGGSDVNIEVTPDHAGDNTMVVQAILADGTRSPESTEIFKISSGPQVSWSPDGDAVIGKGVTLTFRPGVPGVTQYRYTLYGEERSAKARPDGTATFAFEPAYSGFQNLQVRSISADGTVSETRDKFFNILDNHVMVVSGYNESWPQGGIGSDAQFVFYSSRTDLVEYVYHVNDGAEQTVPFAGYSTEAVVNLTQNGLNTFYVQGRDNTGQMSPVTEYRFRVGTAPRVTSAQYPHATPAGGAGVEGTFVFSGGMGGIVSFDYQLDGGSATTVATNADGEASMMYTPVGDNEIHYLTVIGHTADGTATDPTTSYIFVSNVH